MITLNIISLPVYDAGHVQVYNPLPKLIQLPPWRPKIIIQIYLKNHVNMFCLHGVKVQISKGVSHV